MQPKDIEHTTSEKIGTCITHLARQLEALFFVYLFLHFEVLHCPDLILSSLAQPTGQTLSKNRQRTTKQSHMQCLMCHMLHSTGLLIEQLGWDMGPTLHVSFWLALKGFGRIYTAILRFDAKNRRHSLRLLNSKVEQSREDKLKKNKMLANFHLILIWEDFFASDLGEPL